ncbi:hypothetical protein H5410_012863 [Solanum commersonii]|uniref:Uncharacterized protein n=1 Tax=Solanum commersonii TaxID=4109 RepID=A0A9J6ASU1_SOLCO|nr:hypothetical protein H5410_012863 [Solanum commersonii]
MALEADLEKLTPYKSDVLLLDNLKRSMLDSRQPQHNVLCLAKSKDFYDGVSRKLRKPSRKSGIWYLHVFFGVLT